MTVEGTFVLGEGLRSFNGVCIRQRIVSRSFGKDHQPHGKTSSGDLSHSLFQPSQICAIISTHVDATVLQINARAMRVSTLGRYLCEVESVEGNVFELVLQNVSDVSETALMNGQHIRGDPIHCRGE